MSYSWKDTYYVDRICDDLRLLGFEVVRDKDAIKYGQSIPEFIKRITSEDLVLLLISDSYLKSIECMKEILELGIENCTKKNVLPFVVNNAEIYDDKYMQYVKYWFIKAGERSKDLLELNLDSDISKDEILSKELEIYKSIGTFITLIRVNLLCSPKELYDNNYKQIIERTGIPVDTKDIFKLKKINQTVIYDLLTTNAELIGGDGWQPVDLSRYDLRNKVLVGKDIDLSGINFRYSRLSTAYLVGAELVGCCFMGSDLRGANLTYANLCDADLRGANLVGIKYDGIKIRNADFSHAIMDSNFKQFVLEHGM